MRPKVVNADRANAPFEGAEWRLGRGWRGWGWRARIGAGYVVESVAQARRIASVARTGSPRVLGRLWRHRPEVWTFLQAPFVVAGWDTATRLRRLADHCAIVERLGTPFDLAPDEFTELARLSEIGPEYRLTLDQPRWMLRDGLLVLSLWEGVDRMFSLAFLLASERGLLVAYVGGVQGRRSPDARAQYRAMTKAAHGIRPRDLLIELFRCLCAAIGVAAIRGVSNTTRHQRAAYFLRAPGFVDPVTLDYDAMWTERGGRKQDGGLFALEVIRPPRDEASVPTRKRADHRRRREILASIGARLTATLRQADRAAVRRH